MKTIVVKFGGAAVATPRHFSRSAEIILARKRQGVNIVAVVSAMGDTTNHLIALAKEVHPDPPRREYDMLVTVGERISVSLLAMALQRRGQPAISFTGSQSGIITTEEHADARIIDVRPHRVKAGLVEGKVVLVCGFQGVSREGEITTLGRGGSDTTAVALAVALNAEVVEFYKDVPGVFDRDPKQSGALLHANISYDSAIDLARGGARIFHERALILAKKNSLPLLVKSFVKGEKFAGTWVGGGQGRSNFFPRYEANIDRNCSEMEKKNLLGTLPKL